MAVGSGSKPDERAARRRRYAIAAAVAGASAAGAAVAIALGSLAGGDDGSDGEPGTVGGQTVTHAGPLDRSEYELAQYQPAAADRLFSPRSFWNRPLPDDAPLDPDSERMVADLVPEVAREQEAGIGPWIQTGSYSTTIYQVPRDQPTVPVALDDPELEWRRTLQAAFERVPIPRGAEPAEGTDGHMTVWQPATDKLWEFYRAREEEDGWHAAWGGAIEQVSKSPGYYTEDAWPGAGDNWGATATSLPVAGGVMLIDELVSGEIGHALAVNLPFPREGEWSWPAQRSDGTGPPEAIPEGARLRLDPELDLDRLDLHPVARMMAEAVQDYGMVVRDRTQNAIGFAAEDPAPTGENAYRDPETDAGLFEGLTPTQFLGDFPWEHLQVLELKLCDNPYEFCEPPPGYP
jgi:hypothetical protein